MNKDKLKKEKYSLIIENLRSFLETYDSNSEFLSLESKLSSLVSLIKNNIPNLNFVGFYMAKEVKSDVNNSLTNKYELKDGQILQIGVYNSDILATPVIEYGKGVVGTCWEFSKTIIEEDVSKCKNYIACDDVTKSEICVPLFSKNNIFLGVLDIDSTELDNFDNVDKEFLENLLYMVA